MLKTVARQRLAAGQGELDLGLDAPPEAGGPLPITASRMGHLCQALSAAYDTLGFDRAAGGDEAFRHVVLTRIIEPTSKLDSLRVLPEAGIAAVSYRTLTRRLPVYSRAGFITVGLLTDASGFPLMVNAFEGNKAETTTMPPTRRAFMAAHGVGDVIIAADPLPAGVHHTLEAIRTRAAAH